MDNSAMSITERIQVVRNGRRDVDTRELLMGVFPDIDGRTSPEDAERYMFQMLRALDNMGCQRILPCSGRRATTQFDVIAFPPTPEEG